MFSLRSTLFILIILIIPLILRFSSFKEPYPAVLLPSGASKVPVSSNKMQVKFEALYAISRDSSWKIIDDSRFFYPIPPQYQRPIIQREFGLKDKSELIKSGHLTSLLLKLNLLNNNTTAQDKEEVKNWLRNKLKEQNFTTPVLKIVKKKRTISLPSGKVLSENNINEKVIYLE